MDIVKNPKIDWLGKKWIFLGVSAVLGLVSALSIVAAGRLNLGVDFTGGTLVYVKMKETPDLERIRRALAAAELNAEEVTRFDEPAMNEVRHVLDLLLTAHDPFPAFAVDRRWNAVMMNSSGRLLASLLGVADDEEPNLLKVALHPNGIRRFCLNWDQRAAVLVQRLHRERLARPADDALAEVYEEVMAYPGLPSPSDALLPSGSDLVVPVHYRLGGIEIRLITTITTLGAAYDVTLEELRLEVSYPADAASEAVLRGLAAA